MKLMANIEILESRLLKAEDAFQDYKKEHPKTKKTPADFKSIKYKPTGQTIGKTETGKPVADSFSHPSHKKFNSDEHDDAGNLHESLARKTERQMKKTKNPKELAALQGKMQHHEDQHSKHWDKGMNLFFRGKRRGPREIEDL